MYQLQEIKRMRKVLGLTQSQLASMAGVSQSLIAKIEGGEVDPGYARAYKIFSCLDDAVKEEGGEAKDIMVRDLICISSDKIVSDAVRLMSEKAVSQLPVVSDGEIVGGISDGLLVGRVAHGDGMGKILTKKVADVMSDPFPTVGDGAPLDLVAKILSYYNAVLVYSGGRAVGIITRSDLLRRGKSPW